MENQLLELIKKDNLPGLKLYTQRNPTWRTNRFFEEDFSLVHLVTCCDKPKLLKWLLQNGIDPNSRTKSGDTVLHLAIEVNSSNCLKELLNKKADTELRDYIEEVTPLLKAILAGDDTSIEILINAGANIQCKDKEGNTGLHLAIDIQKMSIIDLLLDNGVDITIENNDGYTPLHFACKRADSVLCS